jgi:hypothetical protein
MFAPTGHACSAMYPSGARPVLGLRFRFCAGCLPIGWVCVLLPPARGAAAGTPRHAPMPRRLPSHHSVGWLLTVAAAAHWHLSATATAAAAVPAFATAPPPPPCPPDCRPACQPACVSGGAVITLEASTTVVATTRESFIGLTLDYANICNRTANHSVIGSCTGAMGLPLTSHLAHLASMNPTHDDSGDTHPPLPRPGLLRIGGSLQDSVLFLGEGEACPVDLSLSRFAAAQPPSSSGNTALPAYQCSQDDPNGVYGRCFSTDRMEQLCLFANASNLRLVVGLNACMGRASIGGKMNVSSLEPFLRFVASCQACRGTLYGWELGK